MTCFKRLSIHRLLFFSIQKKKNQINSLNVNEMFIRAICYIIAILVVVLPLNKYIMDN